MTVLGVLLAAGAGRRMGTPKVLLRDDAGVPRVARAIGALLDGGCDSVLVVTGASAQEATRLLDETGWSDDPAVEVVVAKDWDEGMGASVRAGLSVAVATEASCALVSLVDLHDVGSDVVERVLALAPDEAATLARASYDGRPGHPVLLGRHHWAGVIESVRGDVGARDYLATNRAVSVECGDLATGRDTDTLGDLER